MEDEAPRRGGTAVLVALTAAVIFAGAVGGAVYQSRQRRPLAAAVSITFASRGDEPNPIRVPRSDGGSGLGLVQTLPGLQWDSQQKQNLTTPEPGSKDSALELARASEGRVEALAREYTRRYPVIRQYGRDWMSYPDLKKLNDDYMKNHDPAAFLVGLAQSANFPKLVKKYAGEQVMRAFVLDGVRATPAVALEASFERIDTDVRIKTLVQNVGKTLGLPPELLGHNDGVKIDEQQVVQRLVDAHPELKQNVEKR